jgi:hypothetical protein
MVVLFTTLALPFLAIIVVVDYTATSRAVTATSEDMVDRFNNQIVRELVQTIDPVVSLTRSAAMLAAKDPLFFRQEASWDFLRTYTEHSPIINTAYIGFADGSIAMAAPASEKAQFFGKAAPPQTRNAFWLLDRQGDQVRHDQLVFKSSKHTKSTRPMILVCALGTERLLRKKHPLSMAPSNRHRLERSN